MTKSPRGIRSNNPGNIIRVPGVRWEGQSERQSGRFVRFDNPVYGIRAIARVLITYADARKARDGSRIDTVREVIERWAPPSENDTDAYAAHVAQRLNVEPDQIIEIKNYDVMKELVKAIILHENGVQPYTDSQIDKALVLAGIEPPQKSLQRSRTIKGAQVATAGVGLGAIAEVLRDVGAQIQPLVPYLDTMKWVFVVVALIGIGVTVYARLDDRRRGLR